MEKAPEGYAFMKCERMYLNYASGSSMLHQKYRSLMGRYADIYNAGTPHNFAVLSDNGLFGHTKERFLWCHEQALSLTRGEI